jgi:CBS domain containing-hemolysin-like protein
VFAVDEGASYWSLELLKLLCIPALVLVNGFFVAAEFALVAVRKTRIEELVHHGVTGAKAVERAVAHLGRTIAATQLGVTLASIGLGFVGEPILADLIWPAFHFMSPGWGLVATHSVAATLALILITFMHVVFGELIPKTYALQRPDRTSLWVARPLGWFANATRPLTLLMNGTATLLLRCLGLQTTPGEAMVHSVEELLLLIEDTEEAGILDSDQADYVENVFRLSSKTVAQCMVPRDKMAALEVNTPPDKVLEAVRNGAHTRIPVYEGTPDQVVGIVNTKDLFYLFSLQGIVVLQDAMYPALILKPQENLANALRLFRKSHRHMAIVRDENGKVLGLITLEDVLEEIIGDIEDEHDRPTPKVPPRKRPAMTAEKMALIRSNPLLKAPPALPPPQGKAPPRT